MGWLDTPEGRRRQHVQVIAGGNIRDLDRIHERDRRRKINAIFWFLFIISGILGLLFIKGGLSEESYYLFGICLLFLIILIFRYGLHKNIKLKKSRKDWEKLHHVPDWVHRKMKKRRTNRVNGEHYVYLRKQGKYYRMKKHG